MYAYLPGNLFPRNARYNLSKMLISKKKIITNMRQCALWLVALAMAPAAAFAQTSTAGPLICPTGYAAIPGSGYADTVIISALNSPEALNLPETAGTTATNSNSARLNNKNPTLIVDMIDLVPENAIVPLTIAKNKSAANYVISVSPDNSTYSTVATYNTGTLDSLQPLNITVPTGGARYVRFQRTSGSLWVGGMEYTNICAVSAQLTGAKSVSLWDPLSQGLYAIPGNDVIYSITVSNMTDGATDVNSVFLVDTMPSDIAFYNGDIDDSGPETNPVSFSQTAGAGLTFNYATDVGYSNSATKPTSFTQCNYSPTSGYDPTVTHICFNPKDALVGGDPDPSFILQFRAMIE